MSVQDSPPSSARDDVAKLITEIQEFCETSHYLGESPPRSTLLKAAAALEAQQAEIARLRSSLEESLEVMEFAYMKALKQPPEIERARAVLAESVS